jgi:hypothetical protein
MKRNLSIIAVTIFWLFAAALVLFPATVLADGWGWEHHKPKQINPYEDQNGFFYGNSVVEALERQYDELDPDPGQYNPLDVCNYLWRPRVTEGRPPNVTVIDAGGLFQQLQLGIGAFRNTEPEELGTLTINKPEKTWKGYTLLSSAGGGVVDRQDPDNPDDDILYRAALLDMDGNIIHGWSNVQGVPFKLYPGGYLMGGGEGGFGGRKMVIQDWCGNETWRWEGLPQWQEDGTTPEIDDETGLQVYDARQHHDFQLEGAPAGYYAPGVHPSNFTNPKTLILSNHDPESLTDGWPNCPDTKHISNYGLIDDAIYELDEDKNVVWKWFACEHFEQMGFSDVAKEGVRYTKYGGGGAAADESDWTHFNNVNYLGPNKWWSKYRDWRFHPDNIIFDSRSNNMIGIIARHDHPRGEFVEGDIVWRVGPDYMAGPEARLGQIIGPHMAHMIPAGLPGAGNILVFDNGGNAGYGTVMKGCKWTVDTYEYDAAGNRVPAQIDTFGVSPAMLRDYSRVVEFDPIKKEIVWEYKNEEEYYDGDIRIRKFLSTFISNATRLPNGNTLICEGNMGRVFEVTRHGEIVWEYIADGNRQGAPGVIGAAVYRAYRVPYWWVPRHLLHTECPEPEPKS